MEKRVTTTFNEKWQKRHSWLTFEEGNNKMLLAIPLKFNCGKVKNYFSATVETRNPHREDIFTAEFELAHFLIFSSCS